MGYLCGKVILVTGCSSGIGRAIALECARHGARLLLHSIGDTQSENDIRTLKHELDSIFGTEVATPWYAEVTADITQPSAGVRIVEAAISAFGELTGVVHNAGICQFTNFEDITAEQLDKHMSVNFAGPFAVTQTIVQQMVLQGKGGSVVHIASVCANHGARRLTHYSASKAAVLGLNTGCAVEHGKHGIRFNCVSPGTIETAMNKEDLAGPKRAQMEARVPLGRLGVPEDIARPVVFFLSDLSQYVSGQNLIVDGGSTLFYQ